MPKFFGAAFGAAASAAVALLLFFLARHREQQKSSRELSKLEKAFWLDTWATLPMVYSEYEYWKTGLREEASELTIDNSVNSRDVIIEHIRSQFFEASLTDLPRLSGAAQTHLLLFHDNLRIARERLGQITTLLKAIESREKSLFPVYSLMPSDLDRKYAIALVINDLITTLDHALTHAWLAQSALDVDHLWRGEAAQYPAQLWGDREWVLKVEALAAARAT